MGKFMPIMVIYQPFQLTNFLNKKVDHLSSVEVQVLVLDIL